MEALYAEHRYKKVVAKLEAAAKECVEKVKPKPKRKSTRWSRNWQYRQSHPICEGCQCAPSVDTHHVVPIAKGGCDEDSNLVALCLDCHAAMHPELSEKLFKMEYRVNFSHRWDTTETRMNATSAQTNS